MGGCYCNKNSGESTVFIIRGQSTFVVISGLANVCSYMKNLNAWKYVCESGTGAARKYAKYSKRTLRGTILAV